MEKVADLAMEEGPETQVIATQNLINLPAKEQVLTMLLKHILAKKLEQLIHQKEQHQVE